jgi:hypothetical protein
VAPLVVERTQEDHVELLRRILVMAVDASASAALAVLAGSPLAWL